MLCSYKAILLVWCEQADGAHLWSQRAIVCLWVVWVVILIDIKVVRMLLAQRDCHVLVVIWVVSRDPAGSNNDFTTI